MAPTCNASSGMVDRMPLPTLIELLAPPLCAGCGATAGAAEPLCGRCRGGLRWLGPDPVELQLDRAAPGRLAAGAAGCAAIAAGTAAGAAVAAGAAGCAAIAAGTAAGAAVAAGAAGCAAAPPLLAWAPLAYEGPARGVVRALKFKGARRAAGTMAAQIVANAPPGWLDDPRAALVPAPLHPKRARSRGYNQARLLADAIAERTGLPVADCLDRTGSTRTQVGRDRRERLTGIAGSVRLRAPPPARALLVDDVITTGATLLACGELL